MPEDMFIRHCAPTLAGLKTGNIFTASYYSISELDADIARLNTLLECKGLKVIRLRAHGGRALIYVYRPGQLQSDLDRSEAREILRRFGYAETVCVNDVIEVPDSANATRAAEGAGAANATRAADGAGAANATCAADEPDIAGAKEKTTAAPRSKTANAEILEAECGGCMDQGACVARLMQRISASAEFPHEIGLFLGYPPEDVKGFIECGGRDCKACGYWKVYGDVWKAETLFRKYTKCTGVYLDCLRRGLPFERLAVRKHTA